MTTTSVKLDARELRKGMYVLVEKKTTEGKDDSYYEIGIVRETDKILVLTDAGFDSLPPKFNEQLPPFLPNPYEEVELDYYPVYSIETKDVIALLALQKLHMKQQLPVNQAEFDAFEKMEEFLMNLCLQP